MYKMYQIVFLSLLFFVKTNGFSSGALPPERVAAYRNAVAAAFSLPLAGSYGKSCVNGCALGHSLGSLVRLAFHDSAGGGGGNGLGGANGCIDSTASDNNGLASVVSRLSTVLSSSGDKFGGMSLGDAFVLAANLAIEVATTLDPADAGQVGALNLPPAIPLILPFRSGRVDVPSCLGLDSPLLPRTSSLWSGSLGSHSLSNVFGRMGLAPNEIVALMGAHTIGRLSSANSGINGQWVPATSASFSNQYFRGLIGVRWTKNAAQSPDVWNAGGGGNNNNNNIPTILLRPDVELALNTTTPTGASACPAFDLSRGIATGCPRQAATAAAVELYARSQTAWHAAFSEAWVKMTQFNQPALLPSATSALTGTLTPSSTPRAPLRTSSSSQGVRSPSPSPTLQRLRMELAPPLRAGGRPRSAADVTGEDSRNYPEVAPLLPSIAQILGASPNDLSVESVQSGSESSVVFIRAVWGGDLASAQMVLSYDSSDITTEWANVVGVAPENAKVLGLTQVETVSAPSSSTETGGSPVTLSSGVIAGIAVSGVGFSVVALTVFIVRRHRSSSVLPNLFGSERGLEKGVEDTARV